MLFFFLHFISVCACLAVCVAVRGQLEEVGSSPFHLDVTRGIEPGSPSLQGPSPGNHFTACAILAASLFAVRAKCACCLLLCPVWLTSRWAGCVCRIPRQGTKLPGSWERVLPKPDALWEAGTGFSGVYA